MLKSGITLENELKVTFQSASAAAEIVKFGIEDEKFVIHEHTGDFEEKNVWEKAQSLLEPKMPCFIMLPRADKYVMISFVPDNAHVRKKMLYASSAATLRSSLQAGDIILPEGYSITDIDECTETGYNHSVSDTAEDAMTFDELHAINTEKDAVMTMGTASKSAILPGIPIKFADNTMAALESFRSGGNNVELILDPKTEILEHKVLGEMSLEELVASMPVNEPRYYILNYKHTKDLEDASKNVFIYYCPGKAPPRLKMFYSTSKVHILTSFKKLEIAQPVNIEFSETKDITEECIMLEIYPPVVAKEIIAKPKAGGRGKRAIKAFAS